MSELLCHMCGSGTEFRCERCGEPVCVECCAPNIEIARCAECEDACFYILWADADRRAEIQEVKDKEREEKNKAARDRYWMPENVAKRKAQREAEWKAQEELSKKQMEEAISVVNELFYGMF